MPPSQFREGQKVRIIGNHNFHGFAIGEIVTLINSGSISNENKWAGYRLCSPNYLQEIDLEPLETAVKAVKKSALNPLECCDCGCDHNKDFIEDSNGKQWCDSCHGDNFIFCGHCEVYARMEDSIEIDNSHWFCNKLCAHNQGYYKCDDCGNWYNHNDEGGINHHGNRVCGSCVDNYCDCQECGDTIQYDRAREIDGEYYCNDCYGESSNRVIKNYSFKPSEYSYAKMPRENTIYLGMELEVEGGGKDEAEKLEEWCKAHSIGERVYFKEDGSLDDGFEIVVHPTTLKAYRRKFPLAGFLERVRRLGLECESSCGLHIHFSKKKMSEEALYIGKIFFYKAQDQILPLSGRMRSKLEYCNFDTSLPQKWNDQDHGKYSAFNTCASEETAEVRVFAGTTSLEGVKVALEFTDAFAEWVQTVTVSRALGSEGLWSEFITYCKAKRKYPTLCKVVKEKDII